MIGFTLKTLACVYANIDCAHKHSAKHSILYCL